MKALAVILLCLACAAPAQADIYARRDASGAMVYSNVPPAARATVVAPPVRAARAGMEAPEFPRIARAEQQQRDRGRQSILHNELSSEEQLLQRARADGAAPDVQHRHLSNIAALKRELAALR
jgi:hypothetical protein